MPTFDQSKKLLYTKSILKITTKSNKQENMKDKK